MNNASKSNTKEIIIIIAIVLVFVLVFFVFYTEIIKYNKAKDSKKNFYVVKQELTTEINKCKKKDTVWIFNISCEQKLTTAIIADYFNKTKKLKNPYDGHMGVQGTSGSVQIKIRKNSLVLSVDTDANSGIDIDHTIYID